MIKYLSVDIISTNIAMFFTSKFLIIFFFVLFILSWLFVFISTQAILSMIS